MPESSPEAQSRATNLKALLNQQGEDRAMKYFL